MWKLMSQNQKGYINVVTTSESESVVTRQLEEIKAGEWRNYPEPELYTFWVEYFPA